MIQTDVLIVGAGPIGIELAVALKHAGVDYLHLDAGQIGQTIDWYPRQARFFSSPDRIAIAGVPLVTQDQSKATREEYLAYLRGVVQQFDLDIRTFERVARIRQDDDGYIVESIRGGEPRTYATRRVVLAIGDMHAPRMLHVPGEDLEHVSHYFDEPHPYFRQRLLIVGGRNSAVEAAIRCHRAGARVTISYRRPDFDNASIKYWLMPELESLIKHGKIGFRPCTLVHRITPQAVTLIPAAGNGCPGGAGEHEVAADFVLLLTGYLQDCTLFRALGIEQHGENLAPQVDPETMETNVPGIYVIGTAVAGTQERFRLFIENCHPHVTKVVRAITGNDPPRGLVNQAAKTFALPES